ncbi:MAG TPA: retropepsin-like aspartic protease [Candidatus Bathyarchaeia archaeon]|nr:retropepsin-like aspartic protease [Candidatus Bathyarchaeia archaeon]
MTDYQNNLNPAQTPFNTIPTIPSPLAQPPLVPTPPQVLNIQQQGFTQQPLEEHFSWKAWVKFLYIILFIAATLGAAYFLGQKVLTKSGGKIEGDVLVQTRYQPVLWKDFGEVFEPMIKIPLYYPSEGYVQKEFLLDSGALVSSLPREEAKKMGLSLAKLPRSTFGGFGNTTSFAYRSEVKLKLGEQEVVVPAVFTEAAGTKPILGRSGFFERYNIYFNSTIERIEIRK